MKNKSEILAEIKALAKQHNLSQEEIFNSLAEGVETNIESSENSVEEPQSTNVLFRVLYHLGGVCVFAGIYLYLALNWEGLNVPTRLIVTLGAGIVVLILAILALQEKKTATANMLFACSSILQPAGLLECLRILSTGQKEVALAAAIVSLIMALQYGTLFWQLRINMLLSFAVAFAAAAVISAGELIHFSNRHLFISMLGAAIIALMAFIRHTPHRAICGFWFGFSSFVVIATVMNFFLGKPVEFWCMPILLGLLVTGVAVRSRAMLVFSSISLFSYLCYFSYEHFLSSVSWPICLIIFGILFLLMSQQVLRMQKYFWGINNGK